MARAPRCGRGYAGSIPVVHPIERRSALEVMCNEIGCIYIRVNVPLPEDSEDDIGMMGVHRHLPEGTEVTADNIVRMLEECGGAVVTDLDKHFESLGAG